MINNQLNRQIALTLLDGIGYRNAKLLLAYLGSEEKIFDEKLNLTTKVPGLKKERFRKLNRKEALEKADIIRKFNQKHHINTMFYTDRNYPRRLKECSDSPVLLYYKGDIDFNPRKSIAIVGTRNMTSYGKQILNEFIATIAPYNVQVVSGLALGVDGYAHEKCIEHGVSTIGVLGHGLDRIYPSQHKQLAQSMIQTKGCGLITEFTHNTLPDRENFPQRNRIVAGMTDATIVIESGAKGGSLITAHLANDYNREVFAFPGDIHRPYSKGCNHLIAKNKAHLITCGKDFIQLMGWKKEEEEVGNQIDLFAGLQGDEKKIAKIIKEFEKISIDVLSLKLKKPIGVLSSALLSLELKGVIMSLPGKNYTLGRLV